MLPGQETKEQEMSAGDFVKGLTTPDGVYGPYLKKMPKNPFNGLRTVRIGTVTIGSADATIKDQAVPVANINASSVT